MKNRSSKIILITLSVVLLIVGAMIFVACKKSADDVFGISVTTPPNKTTYYVGEQLDVSGCVITVRTHSGKDYTVNVTKDMVSGFKSTIGDRNMTISYTIDDAVFTTIQSYKVVRALATSITILTQPQKTQYVDGDKVDLEGLTAKVTYSDGSTSEVGSSAFTPVRSNVHLGDTAITVKIDNEAKDIPVEVVEKKVSGIKIVKSPQKTAYIEGETFDPNGMVVNYLYNNNETGDEAIYTIEDDLRLSYSRQYIDIVVYYLDERFDARLPLTIEQKQLTSLELLTDNVKTSFTATSPIEFTGLEAIVTYQDDVSERVGVESLNAYVSGKLFEAGSMLEVGEYALDIYYKYAYGSIIHDTLNITVTSEAQIIALEVTSEASVTEFQVGEEPRFRDLVVKALYNDDTQEIIINDSDMAEGVEYTPDIVAEDSVEIVITYKGLTYSYPITVISDD